MIAKYLWVTGLIIIALLGTVHLYLTFFTNKFSSRNEHVERDMKTAAPILTNETTMWKAWISFNASHSSGIIFIGIMNVYLATRYFTLLQSGHFFFLFNIVTIAFYVFLSKKFWFRSPLKGTLLVLACYVISYILTMARL